jgi:hypothetical protein
MLYKVVRMYQNGRRHTVKSGLYLQEAQAHCRDPETSSRTATSAAGRRRTRENGPWFDGYEADK